MKIKIISVLVIVFALIVNAQTGSINNTLGTGGSFNVKDGTSDFFRVDQLTGNSIFLRNIELGNQDHSTQSIGLITKNGIRFIHNSKSPGTDGFNTFVGLYAGNFPNVSGLNYFASYNTAVGFGSLAALTLGYSNSAMGWGALTSNDEGYQNSAFGDGTLYSNTTGNGNSSFGYHSLFLNSTGTENSAFGTGSLNSNTSGNWNSAFGFEALKSADNFFNSAFGYKALVSTTGSRNSAFGYSALSNNTTGTYNTAIGCLAGSDIVTGNNNICIGYDAQVPNGAVYNQVRIGNAAISYAGIQVAWSITSDRRWKENINPTNLGLNFISKLNPVAYTRKNDENQKIEYGLIAQELEQVLKEEGVENAAMLTIDEEGKYELRYNDLFAPIIKAIQELKQKNDELVLFNKQLAEQNESLRKEIEAVKLSVSDQIELKIKSLLTQITESKDDTLNLSFGE